MRRIICTLTASFCMLAMQYASAQVSLNTINSTYSENFNTLSLVGTSSTVPTGWTFLESGTNANTSYSADNGSTSTGNTYSFGSTLSTDRAFGELTDNNISTYIGANFTNSTGYKITSLAIAYTGEQWRLGGSGNTDSLVFEYSTNATSLNNGTWTRVSGLDLTSIVTSGSSGALNGNSPTYQSSISGSITGLGIANGGTFWIRWSSRNISGANDGLAIDDFSMVPGTTSGNSDIVEDGTFTYPTNINYISYVGSGSISLNTSNSIALGSFTIRDGGSAGSDVDNLPTVLSSIKFDINRPGFIYALGIFDGSTLVAQVNQNPTFPGSLTLSGLNLSAPDDGTKTFTIRAAFSTSVLDNRQIQFTISSATAGGSGSGFSSATAGGAQTSLTGDNNRIEVTATKLTFTAQPSSTAYLSTDLISPPAVSAVDMYGVTDQDFTGTISLGNTVGLNMINYTKSAVSGQANFDNVEFTQRGTTKLYTINTYGLTNDTSRAVTVTNPPQKKWDGEAGTTSWNDAANWKPDGVPDMYDSVVLDNQYVASNYTVDINSGGQKIHFLAIRPYAANKITLEIPATVASDTVLEVRGIDGASGVKIENGGILKNAGPGTSAHTYTFAVDSGTIRIANGGEYIHATLQDHSELIDKLHLDTDNIKGIFMFDVPGTATYDLSINNRTFGTLSLQRTSGGGTYTGSGTGKAVMLGDLEVGTNATFQPSIDSIIIKSDLVSTGTLTPDSATWIALEGTNAQTISGSGTYDIKKLELNNSSSGGITLGRAFSMSNTTGSLLKFTNGKLHTTTTNILTIPEEARTTGGSYKSFVDGPMYLKTNSTDVHLAPVGSDSYYRAVKLAPISTGLTTFYMQYHRKDPNTAGYNTSMMDTILKCLSTIEYWDITRSTTGTPTDAYVTLLWSKASNITPGYENYLRVAYWNGSQWNDKGGNAINGSAYFGSVTSNPEVTSFGEFTLGSLTSVNALPVELTAFNGNLEGDHTHLAWTTVSEVNNKGFQIQRSTDGQNWEDLAFKDGHGTYQGKRDYTYDDYTVRAWRNPVLYYRLKQVDYNGAYQYSPVVKVELNNNNIQNAYYNAAENKIYLVFGQPQNENLRIVLTDMLGRTILDTKPQTDKESSVVTVDVPSFKDGVHILTVNGSTEQYSQKIYLGH